MYNKNRMDNFDLKKYLVENKLSEETNSNPLSAVDLLSEKVGHNSLMSLSDYNEILEQAKAKEIENIKNAFDYGQTDPGMEADEYLDFINFK